MGAGKSSLIQALVGEMEKLEGHVTLKVSKKCFIPVCAVRVHTCVGCHVFERTACWLLCVEQGVRGGYIMLSIGISKFFVITGHVFLRATGNPKCS